MTVLYFLFGLLVIVGGIAAVVGFLYLVGRLAYTPVNWLIGGGATITPDGPHDYLLVGLLTVAMVSLASVVIFAIVAGSVALGSSILG